MSASEWQSLLARAKRGDPEAEWGVADRYGDGVHDNKGKVLVRRSARRAVQWLRRAAEHGCTSAQNNLGIQLGNGESVKKNVREALLWLRKASRAGHSLAASNIAITYRENGKLEAAVRWFRKSVAAGDEDDLVQLGIHYFWGKGVRKNPKAAVRCFRRATKGKNLCEASREDAFFFLGIAYLEGKGERTSIPKARRLFQRANIDNDHPAARTVLHVLSGSSGDEAV
ncbi:MAG TPA: tetratricopeptide repeat protein [Candidatus Acidoferrales bacterium]|nr:tetratricopeptide repeat protein [Candidatus Acidoferrales bacterium]